jgi:hypothetical protein
MAHGQDTGSHPGRKVDRETHRQAKLDDIADHMSDFINDKMWSFQGKKAPKRSTKTGAQLDRDAESGY